MKSNFQNNKYISRFLQWKPVEATIKLSRKLVLPGFDGVPLFDVLAFFVKGMQKNSLTTRAAATSFTFFLALFPAIIFFFTIIPYLPIADFKLTFMDVLHGLMPEHAYQTVSDTIEDIISKPRGGLLSVGFIMALYLSTNGTRSIIDAFNKCYHTPETRNWIKTRMVSLLLVFIVITLIIIAVTLITIGTWTLNFLVSKGILAVDFMYYSIVAVKWLIAVALIFFAISFMFYLAPVKKHRFRFVSAGSTLATILVIFTSGGFKVYVENFSHYNALYGSIGTLIVILLWIYFNTLVLLIGFELNASISHARRQGRLRTETLHKTIPEFVTSDK